VPRKPRPVGGDESARNEISILFAGMPRAVRGEHHFREHYLMKVRQSQHMLCLYPSQQLSTLFPFFAIFTLKWETKKHHYQH